MKAILLVAFVALASLNLMACGGSDKPAIEVGSGKARVLSSGKIDCNGSTCAPSAQYCLVTVANNEVTSSECVAWPASGAQSCDTAQPDASKRQSACNIQNGSWSESCVDANGSVIVSCGS